VTKLDMGRLRSIGVLRGGRTRPRTEETRGEDGSRTKTTTDELGNSRTEHTRRGTAVSHRQDAQVRPQTVTLKDGR
jgi:hypothetical protein